MRPNDQARGIFRQGWASTASLTACICLISVRISFFFFSIPNPELLSKPCSALLVCSCCPFPPDWLLPKARKVCFHPKLQEKNHIIFEKMSVMSWIPVKFLWALPSATFPQMGHSHGASPVFLCHLHPWDVGLKGSCSKVGICLHVYPKQVLKIKSQCAVPMR